jgi:hypothetical protein
MATIIDPKGDVVLVVGTEDKVSIRVSSKVLSIASKVFDRMFTGSFKEALELGQRSV